MTIRAFVEAVNAQNWRALDKLIASNFVRHSEAGGQPGVQSRSDLVSFLRNEYQVFPDAHETIEDMIAEGDKVAVRHKFRGTQKGALGPYQSSGKIMSASYIAIYRLKANRIVEAWVECDNLSGLVQLGHYKPPPQSSV